MAIDLKLIDKLLADYKSPEDIIRRERSAEAADQSSAGAGHAGRADRTPDGSEGEEHVVLGARIMGSVFGPAWKDECLRHSRYWSRRMGLPISRLCLANKLAF